MIVQLRFEFTLPTDEQDHILNCSREEFVICVKKLNKLCKYCKYGKEIR